MIPLPPSQRRSCLSLSHTHTHRLTHMGMCASYTYALRHIGECFHTHTHAHAQGWPLSPSHTQLSSVPSLCLFMATPALIPSLSISITSANSLSSPGRTVFLLPFMLALEPSVSCFFLSVSFNQCLGLYNNRLRIQVNMKQNKHRHCYWHLCQ